MDQNCYFLLDSQNLLNGTIVSTGKPIFPITNFIDTGNIDLIRNFDNLDNDAAILVESNSNKTLRDLRIETTSISYATQRKLFTINKYNFNYKDKANVFEFLKNNTELLDLIIESYSVIRSHFRYDPLTLKLHWDPETGEEDYIILTILTSLRAYEAIQELDKIDEEWWIANLHRANDKLSIDLVYR